MGGPPHRLTKPDDLSKFGAKGEHGDNPLPWHRVNFLDGSGDGDGGLAGGAHNMIDRS